MLKREISYEDYNGEKVTDTFYFNLTKTEIVELEASYDGGLETRIKRIIETQDAKALITEFKKLVLLSYGKRSEDGKRFIKSDEIREEFTQTAAYDALFMELATNADAATNFIKGIIPSDLSKDIEKAMVVTPPVPPQT